MTCIATIINFYSSNISGIELHNVVIKTSLTDDDILNLLETHGFSILDDYINIIRYPLFVIISFIDEKYSALLRLLL